MAFRQQFARPGGISEVRNRGIQAMDLQADGKALV
jgi:hypothetical protein